MATDTPTPPPPADRPPARRGRTEPVSPMGETTSTDSPTGEIARLRAENERLREQLDDVIAGRPITRPAPVKPSFRMSEGTRNELEETGQATDPFTGDKLTRDDLKD